MKIALVTTPPTVRSGIGDYVRHLLPYLRWYADVDLFVERDHDHPDWGDERGRSIHELDPRQFDHVCFQLGNEVAHGFMTHLVRAIGGVVVQHDWVLYDLACAAWPKLLRGGWPGHLRAWREGGLEQAHTYFRNCVAQRRQRTTPFDFDRVEDLDGAVLAGWWEPEAEGRWTSDRAWLRIPSETVREIEIEGIPAAGVRTRVQPGGETLDGSVRVRTKVARRPILRLESEGAAPSASRRAAGDSRRLGCFVRSVRWRDDDGEHELDLTEAAAFRLQPLELQRDRFELPFNHSIVRFADSFIVHSEYVEHLILEDRNAATPIGLLPHGAGRRWSIGDRRERRRALGLPEAWLDSFLVTSFGGVQAHKRIEPALEALALARRTHDDVRLVLAGSRVARDCDPEGIARRLGVEDAVHFAGFVSEEEGWSWLHAGDIALNLRGPTSGGTSGGIYQALSLGRGVIITDAAEQRELPDTCTVKVPLGDGEVDTLARTFLELRDDEERRARLEAGARVYVNEECHWSRTAEKYFEFFDGFPRPKVTRRKRLALKVALAKIAASSGA